MRTVFLVSVDVDNNDHSIHAFTIRTDISWADFIKEARRHFTTPDADELLIGYRLNGNPRKWSLLTSELNWRTTLNRMTEKINSQRGKKMVIMEIKDMLVSSSDSAKKTKPTYHFYQRDRLENARKARGQKTGKEKCRREEDIPPVPSPKAKAQNDAVHELQSYLQCQVHTKRGLLVYCRVVKGSKSVDGGHQEINHMQMTLWAKEMVSKTL